jgi:hypothetical protein
MLSVVEWRDDELPMEAVAVFVAALGTALATGLGAVPFLFFWEGGRAPREPLRGGHGGPGGDHGRGGRRSRRHGAARARRAHVRDAAGVQGRPPGRRCHRDAPLEHPRLRPPLRRRPGRLRRHGLWRGAHHVPDLRARSPGAQLLDRAGGDRRRGAGRRCTHRSQPSRAGSDGRSRDSRTRRPRQERATSRSGLRCPTPRPSYAGSRSSSTTWSRGWTGSCPCRARSSRMRRTS